MTYLTLPFTEANYNRLKASRFCTEARSTYQQLKENDVTFALSLELATGRLSAFRFYIPAGCTPYITPKFKLGGGR